MLWFLIILHIWFVTSQAAVYKTSSGSCAAFLANIGTQSDATVTFNGKSYRLPAWSVSILPDCKNVAFNTAKVCFISMSLKHYSHMATTDTNIEYVDKFCNRVYRICSSIIKARWWFICGTRITMESHKRTYWNIQGWCIGETWIVGAD